MTGKLLISLAAAALVAVMVGAAVANLRAPLVGQVMACQQLDLQIKDQDQPWSTGVSNTWHATGMAPGATYAFSGSFVGLQSSVSGLIGITCSYGATSLPDGMAKLLEITSLIYKSPDWQIDCLTGQASLLPGGNPATLPLSQAGWRLQDADGDGRLTFYDLKTSPLSSLPLVSSYTSGMVFQMSVRFSGYAGNNFQGDTFSLAMSYTLTAGSVNSNTCLSAAPNPSTCGQAVKFTVKVSGSGGTPTGTVAFSDGNTVIGASVLTGGTATLSYSGLSVGTHTITAAYGGDANFGPGSDTAVVTVQKVCADSSTSINVSPSPAACGQSVTFTAKVSGTGGTPGGAVTFKDGSSTIGTVNLSGGTAILSYSGLCAGAHTITASYPGDSNFKPSSASTGLVVQKIDSSGTLGAAPNPAASGQTVKFTAKVSGSGGTPTGTVTFKDGSTTIGTASLSGGTATLSYSCLCVGTHAVTASYGGDSTYNAGSASTNVVVQKLDSSASLGVSPNPAVFGQAVKFTAKVSGSGGTPTGSVMFKDGSTTIGTASLSGGTAVLSYSGLTVGTHTVMASYGGDSSYNSSASASATQVVNKAATSTSLNSSGSAKTGKTVTFTAGITVTAPGAGSPGGTVTFMDGSSVIGTVNVSGGSAVLNIATLSKGTHSIKAVYSGDGNFSASTSSAISLVIS